MGHFLLLVGLGVVVFASTNVDDILVLLGFFADPRFRPRQVVVGQVLGIGLLTGTSIALSLVRLVIPPAYVGLLGVAPLGIGLWKLLSRESPSKDGQAASPRVNVLAVGAVTLANGGDNLAVYTPLFSIRRPWEVGCLAAVFLVMTGLWCIIAHRLVRHPAFGGPLRKVARFLLPWVLMALGLYILSDSGAWRLAWKRW